MGKMPLDPEMAAAVDAGQFAGVVNTYLGDVENICLKVLYLPINNRKNAEKIKWKRIGIHISNRFFFAFKGVLKKIHEKGDNLC